MKPSKAEITKVFIQVSNKKGWSDPILRTFDRQSHVKPSAQLVADITQEQVRVSYPTETGLEERKDFEDYAKQLGGHYFRPTLK